MSAEGGLAARLRGLLAALNPWWALRQAEAEAQAADQRLREALDALPTGVVFLDAELRYILWNKAYGDIYRRSSDLFRVGRPLAETLRIGVERGDYPAAIGREEAWLAERIDLLRNPTGERHEQQIRDGRWVLIEERRTTEGGVIGLRVDITDLKTQAAALREALDRAEAAGRAKAQFMANMSHELKTPLNGVIGLAEVLAHSRLTAAQRRLVAEILSSAGQLHTLLGDLLDFNALEAGEVKISPTCFSPAKIARRAAASFADAAEAKGLALIVRIAEDAEDEALGDPDHIGQVLEQLLSNAVKFTAAGRVALMVTARPDGAWRFEVADTGVGFAPEEAERLFASFEQGDGSATREHGGAGLGLAICQRLARLMGGHMEAHGRPGSGATFALELPLGRAAAAPSPGQEGAAAPG